MTPETLAHIISLALLPIAGAVSHASDRATGLKRHALFVLALVIIAPAIWVLTA